MTFPKLYQYKITKKIDNKICYSLYEAVDQTNENKVFLKILDETLSESEHEVEHFLNNACILKSFNNPNIFKVYDYGDDQGYRYIATEPFEGKPINSLIKEPQSLSFQELIGIFIRISSTLRYAHLRGLIHGFINPKSIYINSEGVIKIDDFGFDGYINAILRKENKKSLYLSQYISPEIFEAKSPIDGRVDIYSLGIIMFHTVNGYPPFTGSTVSDIKKQHFNAQPPTMKSIEHDLQINLESIILKSLHKNKEGRFQNLKEIIDSLKNIERNIPQTSKATKSISTTETDFKFKPNKSGQYYFGDRSESDIHNGYDSTYKPRNFLNFVSSLFTVEKLVFSVVAVIILVTILLISSNKIPIPILNNSFTKTDLNEIKTTTDPVSQIGKIPSEENHNQNEDKFLVKDDDAATKLNSIDSSAMANTYQISPKESTPSELEIKPEIITESKSDIALTKENSENKIQATDLTPAVPKDVSTPIKISSAQFYVTYENKPVEAVILVDNQFKGTTDRNGLLLISQLEVNKTYKAEISKEGYEVIIRDFTVTDDSSVFNFTINPKSDIFGTIILNAQPNADSIFINGNYRKGQVPLEITLPGGEHHIRYINESLNKSWEQVINLQVGQVLNVNHDFTVTEFGKIAVSLKNAANYGFGYVYVDGKLWDGTPNTTPLEVNLSVGPHTLEVRREGFDTIPKDTVIVVEKNITTYVSFTLSQTN